MVGDNTDMSTKHRKKRPGAANNIAKKQKRKERNTDIDDGAEMLGKRMDWE
jgi:hypothetical protein